MFQHGQFYTTESPALKIKIQVLQSEIQKQDRWPAAI